MYTKIHPTQNYLKKWLGYMYILSTVVVVLLIFYLELTGRKKDTVKIHSLLLNRLMTSSVGKLLNLENFRYVINNDVCSDQYDDDNLVILLVTSYSGDVEKRSAVRRAYPSKLLAKFGVRRVFLLSLIDEKKNYNHVSQSAIQDENRRFHDIIQGNFIEDYRNLTYKHVMGLQWAVNFCPQAKYIIKMDHDIIFDFYRLNFLLKKLPRKELLLAGYVMTRMKPIREPANKWYVSKEEYERVNYPNFLSGWFYITNPATVRILLKVTDNLPYFWIDDLYVTGLLVERTNITLFKLNRFYTPHQEYLQCCVDTPNYVCDYLVGPTSNDNKLMIKFQKYAEACFYKKCKKRTEENSLKNTCVVTWKDEPFGKGRAIVDTIKIV